MDKKSTILAVDPSLLIQPLFDDLGVTNGLNPGPKTYKGTNIYFLGSGNSKIMIDAGQDVLEYEERLNKMFDTLNFSVSHILITHQHPDHTYAIKFVLSRFPSVVVYKFKAIDEVSLKYDEDLQNKFGFKYTYILSEQTLRLNEYELQIYHLPGHSEDSIGIYDPKTKRLFIGDTILGEGTGTQISNLVIYMKSLQRILTMDVEILLPAHGSIILTSEEVKKHVVKYYEHRKMRENSILEVLEKNKKFGDEELFKEIYQNVPANLMIPARINFGIHMEKLLVEGIVKKVQNVTENDFLWVLMKTENSKI